MPESVPATPHEPHFKPLQPRCRGIAMAVMWSEDPGVCSSILPLPTMHSLARGHICAGAPRSAWTPCPSRELRSAVAPVSSSIACANLGHQILHPAHISQGNTSPHAPAGIVEMISPCPRPIHANRASTHEEDRHQWLVAPPSHRRCILHCPWTGARAYHLRRFGRGDDLGR